MNTASSSHQFHGDSYLVSLSVLDDNKLLVEVEHKESYDQWRATFEKTCK